MNLNLRHTVIFKLAFVFLNKADIGIQMFRHSTTRSKRIFRNSLRI